MKRFYDTISSPLLLISLALPLVLWFVTMVYGLGLSPFEAAGARVFRIFYAALIVCLSVATYNFFRSRLYGATLIALGIILILFQGIYLYGFRFTGKTSLGEGESFSGYYSAEAGPWARLDPLPLVLKKAKAGSSSTCTVMLGGQERELKKGEAIHWNNLKITLASLSIAPLFILSAPDGMELEAGYSKLFLNKPGGDFFQFKVLPHRFYVSFPGSEREFWKKEGEQWKKTALPKKNGGVKANYETFHLKIMRGKLTLFDGDVKKGESIAIEGNAVRFENGAPWIELSVEKARNNYLFYAGLPTIFLGGLVTVLKRRAA